MIAEAIRVQINIVEITVIIKCLKENFIGIGLNDDLQKLRRFLKIFKYQETLLEEFFEIIIKTILNAGHLILIDESHAYTRKGFLQIIY